MKLKKVIGLVVAVVGFLTVGAVNAQSQGSVTDSTTKTDIERVDFRTTQAELGGSLFTRTANASVGGGDVVVGSITACNGGKISNTHTNVRMRDANIRATGRIAIGNISAGC
mgnify:CR=1 FL=1